MWILPFDFCGTNNFSIQSVNWVSQRRTCWHSLWLQSQWSGLWKWFQAYRTWRPVFRKWVTIPGQILFIYLEMFYLNSTLNFGILPVLVFQLEVYYKVDRLLTGQTAQQKGTKTARWYSNKTSLINVWSSISSSLSCLLYIRFNLLYNSF